VTALCGLLALVSLSGSAAAAPVQILNLPGADSPGQIFAFDVMLPDTANLAAYQIDVRLSSDEGAAGVDYFFNDASAASTEYVFPSTAWFASATNLESSSLQRMTLTDVDLSGVDVVSGVNAQVSRVSIWTAVDFTGTLDISIDAGTLILDGPQLTPTPVAEFDSIVSSTMAADSLRVTAVPEPSSMIGLLAASGAVWITTYRLKRRRQP